MTDTKQTTHGDDKLEIEVKPDGSVRYQRLANDALFQRDRAETQLAAARAEIETLRQRLREATLTDITDEMQEAVCHQVGMAPGGWDFVDPKEIIVASINVWLAAECKEKGDG